MIDKKKVTLYVHAMKGKWADKYTCHISLADVTGAGDADTHVELLSEVEIEIDVPDINEKQLKLLRIGSLEKKIKKEKADSHVRVIAIEEKIQSLMCIEAPAL